MDKSTISELISQCVALEGSLRVLADRPVAEAEQAARDTLARINALMAVSESSKLSENSENSDSPEPASPAKPVEVDDTPAPTRERPDLRRSFTLNDKFMFRRELFADSDAELNDTIELLMTMDTLDEAREYLLHDLQWDADNTTVADFMAIITNYFTSRR